MQSYKIAFTTLVTLLSTVSTLVTVGTGVVYSSPPATNPTEDSRQTQADQLFQQGIQHYRANQPKAAIQSWQQALKRYQQLQNRQREGATLGNLGAAYLALGDYRKAIEFLEPFLAIAKTTNNQLSESQALSNLGIAHQELGNYDKAVEYYQQSLVKAQAVGDTQAEKIALKSLALVYADQANYAKAIEYYNQSLTLARKTGDRNSEAQALGNLGILKFLKAAQGQTKAKVPTTLEELVRVSRNLDGIDARRSEAAIKQLYQLLIEPIAEILPKDPKEHVIFIPQESLFLLPFPALLDASGEYLIEKHTILTAPAIQVLDLTRQQRQRLSAGNTQVIQGKDVLVVGNPTMPAELEPLPSAEQEALAIAQLLNTKAITGGQATKVSIVQQLSQARLVHLATHGLLDDVKKLGIPSAIALAPSKLVI